MTGRQLFELAVESRVTHGTDWWPNLSEYEQGNWDELARRILLAR